MLGKSDETQIQDAASSFRQALIAIYDSEFQVRLVHRDLRNTLIGVRPIFHALGIK